MRSRRLTWIIGAVALGGAAGPAAAAWLPPQRASVGPLTTATPQVAINDRGEAAIAWVRGGPSPRMIVISFRQADGSWSRPEGISRRRAISVDPRVAIGPDGRVVVVWREAVRRRQVRVGGRRVTQNVYVVKARERRAGRWGRSRALSSARQKVGAPDVGIDSRGIAVVAWHWGTGTRPTDRGYVGEVQVSESQPGRPWTSPRRLSRSRLCVSVGSPRVAVGAQGHAVVWWQCNQSGGASAALAATRVPGGTFSREQGLPFRAEGPLTADLSVSAGGDAVAVSVDGDRLRWWRGPVSSAGLDLDELPSLASGERIGSDPSPSIAVSSSGDAASIWIDAQGRVRGASIAAALGVSEPATLAPGQGAASGASIVLGDSRRAAAAWLDSTGAYGATRGTEGRMGPPDAISTPGRVPSSAPVIAMNAAGVGIAAWTAPGGRRQVIERADFTAP
ncbi:MAG: hypothetical protein AB7V42_16440 [Thermoleophilia bacterium]